MTTIATLIPAYKPQYLPELFEGLRNQTFRDFRVIVSDGSPRGEITALLRGGHLDALIDGLDVVVVPGPDGAWHNHRHAIEVWNGSTDLVHLHLDDDVIFPEFYRRHAVLHAEAPGLAASVSLRWLTGLDGRPFGTLPLPAFVGQSDRHVVRLDVDRLIESTVVPCENWLGELSNMVFSARAAARFPQPPRRGTSYFGLPDMSLLLEAAQDAPIAVLRDHLGGFRQHPGQTTANTQSPALKTAFLAWVAFALHAWETRRIGPADATRSIMIATRRCLQHYGADPLMADYFALVSGYLQDLPAFAERFGPFWSRLLALNPDTRPAVDPVAPVEQGTRIEQLA